MCAFVFAYAKGRFPHDASHIIQTITEITKRHWVNSEEKLKCANKQCGKKFSLIDRPHHCRKCGDVFCNSCVQYRRKLTLLAQYDPEGKSYKVM